MPRHMPIVFIDISISCHDRLVSVYKHSIYETEEVSFIFRTIIEQLNYE